jgi:hypothetical protein
MRARTEVADIEADLTAALRDIRAALDPQDGTRIDEALCEVETFAAVALRVMRKTNPSKVRDCARTVEIQARMSGTLVLREAA